MMAAVLKNAGAVANTTLQLEEVAYPEPEDGEVLLKVRACGVCRTDLHIVEGELPEKKQNVIPGHQIVGDVIASRHRDVKVGSRVGVSWMGGADGVCPYCREGQENLCDEPVFTGYSRDGGYAQFVAARGDFTYAIPAQLEDTQAAPLLCAGIIGFRSLRRAAVKPGQRVGLFGFGASAHLALRVLQAWDCKVYVSTRGASHQDLACRLGADWVGSEAEQPPEPLHAAVTFAPSGAVVLAALRSLRKGGIVAINAIHLDEMPAFDYDSLLWGERELRSVANMTRDDAKDFLAVAAEIQLRPEVTSFPLERVGEALLELKRDRVEGAAVVCP